MIDSIQDNKEQIRKLHLQQREAMTPEEISDKGNRICEAIANTTEYKLAKQLFCYFPLGNEVNMLPLVLKSLNDGKIICFPKVISKTRMKFYKVSALDELEIGKFNVLEPKSTEEIVVNQESLMLVPGVVFDEENYRIGFGGGYYDRYLSTHMNKFLTTFGIGYDWQVVKKVPRNSFDVQLDRIITER